LAFLPNELWIHAGDAVRWSFDANELHTVTFLQPGQVRPALYGPVFGVFVGCPGATPDGSSFDGSACVSASPSTIGQSYSVTFPKPGNFKLVCLVHPDMTGTVHVLNASAPLPHNQSFYDSEANHERAVVIGDASGLAGPANSAQEGDSTAGIGAILSTGGGSQTASLQRFLQSVIIARVGDTVEWTNRDPSINHTVTFGTEPSDPRPPFNVLPPDPDGARHAVISSPSDSVNSGLLAPPPQDRIGLPQSPVFPPAGPGTTRFRVTFTAPGVFNYFCSLHDDLGMKGVVIVHP
jgi:plastocyanin